MFLELETVDHFAELVDLFEHVLGVHAENAILLLFGVTELFVLGF